MSAPKRIQRQRTEGWRAPAGAIYCGRPSKWGNPFAVNPDDPLGHAAAAQRFRQWLDGALDSELPELVTKRDRILADLHELRGHDLMCWCRLDQSCHVDVLLDLANAD